MKHPEIDSCISKIEVILENKNAIENFSRWEEYSFGDQHFLPFVGLCTNVNLYSLINVSTNLLYFNDREHKILPLCMLNYLSLSFCVKNDLPMNLAYPIGSYSSKPWNNPQRWEFAEHCLNILKHFKEVGSVPKVPLYAESLKENLKW